MRSEHDEHAARAADELAIRHLVAAYADAVTRRDWDGVAACFLPDATTTLDLRRDEDLTFTGGDSVARFVDEAVDRFEFFELTIVNSIVELDGAAAPNDASGRTYICELRLDRETRTWSHAYGLYRDRFHRRDEMWRFADRRYASLARVTYPTSEVEVFPIPGT